MTSLLNEHRDLAHVLAAALQEILGSARRAGADLARLRLELEQRLQELSDPRERMAVHAALCSLSKSPRHIRAVALRLARELEADLRQFRALQSRLAEAEVEARLDPLTQLLNRRGFHREVQALHESRGSLAGCALLFLDIDRFKRVNDRHGHEVGDRVLSTIGVVIRESIQTPDLAARLGGEEFAVLLTDATCERARNVAQNMRSALDEHVVRDRRGLPLEKATISVGIAEATADENVATLIDRADAAMYRAKRKGGDSVAYASHSGGISVVRSRAS